MKENEYQKMYQNIKEKAPLESGVQPLVYMFLFEMLQDTDYQLIVIDRMDKKTQFVTPAGISDLAIVSDEFCFSKENKEKIISYVEVKGININLYDFKEQIQGQLLSIGRILCTNGSEWKCYDIEKYIECYSQDDKEYQRKKGEYLEIKNKIETLESKERELAKNKSSCAHAKKHEYREGYEENINSLEKEKKIIFEELQKLLKETTWLQNVMDSPILDVKLYDNGVFNGTQYMVLKSKLYDVMSTW